MVNGCRDRASNTAVPVRIWGEDLMHSFRLRLILALIAGVTLLSIASTYFEVLEHKHILRQELEWRSSWMGESLKPQMVQAFAQGSTSALAAMAANAKAETGALG